MAHITNLGRHVPSALKFAQDEGIISSNPQSDEYHWISHEDAGVLHEILYTKKRAVWSRGGNVQRILNFSHEGQDVTNATFAYFPSPTGHDRGSTSPHTDDQRKQKSLAIVIFLSSLAHVSYLGGSSHLVNLSFEVEKAFPCAHGLILQRRSLNARNQPPPPTPALPQAPPNSFRSSQVPTWGSPVFSRASGAIRPSRLSINPKDLKHTSSILDFTIDPTSDHTVEGPRHFLMTDPLADVSVIAEVLGSSSTIPELDMLDTNEEIFHVSPLSLSDATSPLTVAPLVVALSFNPSLNRWAVWHAICVEQHALNSQLDSSQSTTTAAAKAKRRSSFNPRTSTGTSTPIARVRDGHREISGSFAGNPNARRTTSGRHSEAFDPDSTELDEEFYVKVEYDPEQAHPIRDPSRRTSSFVARAELPGQSAPGIVHASNISSSFVGNARIPQSFGSFRDRTSFGRSRLSGRVSNSGSYSLLSDLDEISNQEQLSRSLAEILVAASIATRSKTEKDRKLLATSTSALTLVFIRVGTISMDSTANKQRDALPLPDTDLRVSETRALSSDLDILQGNLEANIVLEFPRLQKTYSVQFPLRSVRIASSPAEATKDIPRQLIIPSQPFNVANLPDVTSVTTFSSQEETYLAAVRKPDASSPEPSIVLSRYVPGFKGPLVQMQISHLLSMSSTDLQVSAADFQSHDFHLQDSSQREVLVLQPNNGPMGSGLAFYMPTRPSHSMLSRLTAALDFASLHVFGLEPRFLSSFVAVSQTKPGSGPAWEWRTMVTAIFSLSIDENALPITTKLPATQSSQPHIRSNAAAWSWAQALIEKERTSHENRIMLDCIEDAQVLARSIIHGLNGISKEQRLSYCVCCLAVCYYFREESRLDTMSDELCDSSPICLDPVISQLAHWLSWRDWITVESDQLDQRYVFDERSLFAGMTSAHPRHSSFLEQLRMPEQRQNGNHTESIEVFLQHIRVGKKPFIRQPHMKQIQEEFEKLFIPRSKLIRTWFKSMSAEWQSHNQLVELMSSLGLVKSVLETLPEAIACLLRHHIEKSKSSPPTTWSAELLEMVDRQDFKQLLDEETSPADYADSKRPTTQLRDIRTICSKPSTSTVHADGKANSQRALLNVIFRKDKRWQEAAKLLDPLRVAVAESFPAEGMAEAQYLEVQKALAQEVYLRTMALPAGQAIMTVSTRNPVLTEKINISSFNTTCNFQPSNNTVSVDRSGFTEEKVCWAFFHAGVNAGLRLVDNATGIDTSWFVLNRPSELGNRHAGLLLALGLRGHLKHMAKWLAFKYLTPKHSMTSISLLLGLSASHMGSMDAWVTRVLSVHVTRLLPPGAAELNLTPLTQAAGMMGIGLLYYNTQHRRMSEALLSEVEYAEDDDPAGGSESFRDESYRLAAGLALGFVNIGRGRDLHTLHDLHVTERLLTVATGPRDINAVHLLDQAVAGATIAITLIYMKTMDSSVAKKIDIPLSVKQFDYVRPDMLMLRTISKHLIMWSDIQPSFSWVHQNTPAAWRERSARQTMTYFIESRPLSSHNIPFYNVIAGLCLSIAFRFAGTGNEEARKIFVFYFDQLEQEPVLRANDGTFDSIITRNTVLRVLAILSLSMAIVMAGTGDLESLRRQRVLHAKIEDGMSFGLHQANHMAMGILFMGHGRYSFHRTNLGLAAMLCAFYPIFPCEVLDNQAHLQALRHFWVFAAEPRCLIPRDSESGSPVICPITIIFADGTRQSLVAPCLVPELDGSVAQIVTTSPEHWPVVLDFANNPAHLEAFRRHQTVFLRRKSLLVQRPTMFEAQVAVLSAENAVLGGESVQEVVLDWLMSVDALRARGITKADLMDALHVSAADEQEGAGRVVTAGGRATALDDALVLWRDVQRPTQARMLALRMLLGWYRWLDVVGEEPRWLRREWVDGLREAVKGLARSV